MLALQSKLNSIKLQSYKSQLNLIRQEIDRIDGDVNLDLDDDRYNELYDELLVKEYDIILGMRRFAGLADYNLDSMPAMPKLWIYDGNSMERNIKTGELREAR